MAGRKDRVAGPGKGNGCNCTALRKTYGKNFAEGCGDDEKLSDVLH